MVQQITEARQRQEEYGRLMNHAGREVEIELFRRVQNRLAGLLMMQIGWAALLVLLVLELALVAGVVAAIAARCSGV